MPDSITLLKTYGPALTKTFKADGSVDAYDDAGSFSVVESEVTSLRDLSEILTEIEGKSKRCIIRGKFIGKDKAEKGGVTGSFSRSNANFDDCPHHWFMVDIDKYEPGFSDPVHDPVQAIKDFIEEQLPACFKDVSFHWQLSSSAGTPGKEHILKAHVWFWSETAYTSAQMYAWAKEVGPRIDKAVYRRVQIHYTANPIFEEGVHDPVPKRSGFHQGSRENVPLVISQDILEAARATGSGSGGNDMKLIDPSEKEGLVGAYHRVFEPHTVLMEHLEGMFEPGSNERRWTWLDGGGTPEGVWVHDDGMHVGATHNTWPIDGIANLWDLVRILKFGHLDQSEDDFEQFDIDERPIQAKPSSIAMLEWAGNLSELKDQLKEERKSKVDEWKEEIDACEDASDLELMVAPRIREADGLSATAREQIAVHLKARIDTLAGIRMPIREARRMVAPASHRSASTDAPEWAKYWVWDCETDQFVNTETKHGITERSYNARYDRYMAPFSDENGVVPRASDFALRVWDTKVVDRTIYNPVADLFYTDGGIRYMNTYRGDLVPEMPDKFNAAHLKAIRILEEHTEILIPDARERMLFLDYLAYCVKHPGAKIRWSPLLKGVEGDGKSAFIILMGHCLGHQNVRILNSVTLEKSDFTSWGTGQCFTGVEEVKLHGHNRYDIYNKLKPYISNDVVEVHKKGRDPYNVPNTTNYLLLSNFDDAVPVNDNDRRVMFIRSPFNTKEEMFAELRRRLGMTSGEYFDRLFDQSIKPHAGAIRKWLLDRELSAEFAADGRAPITVAREMVVELSIRDDESAVLAAIEEGGLGVYPEIVSTWHLNNMIRNLYDVDLRSSRISSVLVAIGYKPLGGQVKWRGRPCRMYFRGERPADPVQPLLEALEKAREDTLVEEDFHD